MIRALNGRANEDILVERKGIEEDDDGPPIFEALTSISEGAYPRETIVTYEVENVDLFEAFNHETGIFRAPFNGRFKIVFEYQMLCRTDLGQFHLRKNGVSYHKSGCSRPNRKGDTSGTAEDFLTLHEGDTLEVYSGTADLISDEVPLRFAAHWLE